MARLLVNLICLRWLTNIQVNDALVLLRDIAGDTASKVAANLRPDADALARIDQPAEDNLWHDKPDINKESLKAQLKQQTDRFKPAVSFGLPSPACMLERPLIPSKNKQDVQGAADASLTSATGGREDASVSQIDARAGAGAAQSTLQQATERNVAPEDREKAQQLSESAQAATSEYHQRTKEFLASKMPQERREQVVWRLKKMIVEIQGHPDCMISHVGSCTFLLS